MAAVERAYTAEYYYVAPSNYAEDFINQLPSGRSYGQEQERVREKSKVNKDIKVLPEIRRKEVLSQAGLLRAVITLLLIGAMLVGTVWMSAKATEIKYSINRINKESLLLEDEIALLNIKIESANSIEMVEAFAIAELGMRYPKAEQCIQRRYNIKVCTH